MDELLTPRSALDAFVRPRTPQWLSQTLKIKLETLSLEDLFANCWLLGRVADTAESLLNNTTYRCPPPELGNRPYRDVISDIERFHVICDSLAIDDNSRITLADVEQRKAGTRVALCLWGISDALRARGYTSAIPEFAPASDYAKFRKAVPRESSKMAVEKYENGGFTPIPAAPRPRPMIPLLPLDTSPALQKYRARAAASEEEKKKMKKAAAAAAAAKKAEAEKESTTKEVEAPPTLATPASTSTKDPPPSLSKWLPGSVSTKKKADLEKNNSDKSGGFTDDASSNGSPTVLSSSPLRGTAPTITNTTTTTTTTAPAVGLPPSFDDYGDSASGGIDVLAAILSPDKNKPAHTQVINALMRTAPGPTPAEEATSAASAPRSKRTLAGFVENTQLITSSRQASARNTTNTHSTSGNNSGRYVKSFTGQQKSSNENENSSEPWWKTPLVGIISAGVAVVVMNFLGGKNKERRNMSMSSGGMRGRGGVQHAGRW